MKLEDSIRLAELARGRLSAAGRLSTDDYSLGKVIEAAKAMLLVNKSEEQATKAQEDNWWETLMPQDYLLWASIEQSEIFVLRMQISRKRIPNSKIVLPH